LNIELITYADLESVEGEPGNFKVKINKRARTIDVDRCTGCGACVENCPVVQQAAV
jgi:heterodisulfide reductase subunit A-like polyferredoxin